MPWFFWKAFIWLGVDGRFWWWRKIRKAHHKPKFDSDGYCVRCD